MVLAVPDYAGGDHWGGGTAADLDLSDDVGESRPTPDCDDQRCGLGYLRSHGDLFRRPVAYVRYGGRWLWLSTAYSLGVFTALSLIGVIFFVIVLLVLWVLFSRSG